MKIPKRTQAIIKKIAFLLCFCLPRVLLAVEFYKNDEVALKEDAPLYFENNRLRTGSKDEHFTVIESRPGEHKVFVLSKDENGKAIALSVSDDAVILKKEGFSLPNANAFDYAGTHFANPAVNSILGTNAWIVNPLVAGGNSLLVSVPVRFVPGALIERYKMIHAKPVEAKRSSSPLVEEALPLNGPFPGPGVAVKSPAPFTITASAPGTNYFVKLVRESSGDVASAYFVHGGSTVVSQAPAGRYIVKLAAGVHWYGEANLLGPSTNCFKVGKTLSFADYGGRAKGYTLVLDKSAFGNLEIQPIGRREF